MSEKDENTFDPLVEELKLVGLTCRSEDNQLSVELPNSRDSTVRAFLAVLIGPLGAPNRVT